MGNLLAAQSGGPTAAINATLRGILEEAMVCGRYDRVYGGLYGIKGILEEQLVELSDVFLSPMDLDLLPELRRRRWGPAGISWEI